MQRSINRLKVRGRVEKHVTCQNSHAACGDCHKIGGYGLFIAWKDNRISSPAQICFGGWAQKLARIIFHTMLKLISGRRKIKRNLWLPITTVCNIFCA